MPELRVRGTGKTEFDLMDDLEELRNAILNKYSNLNAAELPTSQGVPVGTDAIQRGVDALGPTNDACLSLDLQTELLICQHHLSQISRNTMVSCRTRRSLLGNDTNEFIIVYGVNHVATGKAAYANFVPYGADAFNGVGMITDAEFNGTAQEYLPDNPNAKYLYTYKITRNCSGD